MVNQRLRRALSNELSRQIHALPIFPPRNDNRDAFDALSVVRVMPEREVGEMLENTRISLLPFANSQLTEDLFETEPSEGETEFSLAYSMNTGVGSDVSVSHALASHANSLRINGKIENEQRKHVEFHHSYEVEKLLRQHGPRLFASSGLRHSVQRRFCIGVVMERVKGVLTISGDRGAVSSVGLGLPIGGSTDINGNIGGNSSNDGYVSESRTGVIGVTLLLFAVECTTTSMRFSNAFIISRMVDRPLPSVRTWVRGRLNMLLMIVALRDRPGVFKAVHVVGVDDPVFEEFPDSRNEFQQLLRERGGSWLSENRESSYVTDSFGGFDATELLGRVSIEDRANYRGCLVADDIARVDEILYDRNLHWPMLVEQAGEPL